MLKQAHILKTSEEQHFQLRLKPLPPRLPLEAPPPVRTPLPDEAWVSPLPEEAHASGAFSQRF